MQIYAFSSKPPSKTEKICKLLENHQKNLLFTISQGPHPLHSHDGAVIARLQYSVPRSQYRPRQL